MLFANTIILMKLFSKFSSLGVSTTLCNWLFDFLTNRPQTIQISSDTSATLWTPEPSTSMERTVVKFADETTTVGQITENDEDQEEILILISRMVHKQPTTQCEQNQVADF